MAPPEGPSEVILVEVVPVGHPCLGGACLAPLTARTILISSHSESTPTRMTSTRTSLGEAVVDLHTRRWVGPLPGSLGAPLPESLGAPLLGSLGAPLPGSLVAPLPGSLGDPLTGSLEALSIRT